MRFSAQYLPQIAQASPQVVKRLFLAAVGPKRSGKPGALHTLIAAQEKHGQQPRLGTAAGSCQRNAIVTNLEATEQADTQLRAALRIGFQATNGVTCIFHSS